MQQGFENEHIDQTETFYDLLEPLNRLGQRANIYAPTDKWTALTFVSLPFFIWHDNQIKVQ